MSLRTLARQMDSHADSIWAVTKLEQTEQKLVFLSASADSVVKVWEYDQSEIVCKCELYLRGFPISNVAVRGRVIVCASVAGGLRSLSYSGTALELSKSYVSHDQFVVCLLNDSKCIAASHLGAVLLISLPNLEVIWSSSFPGISFSAVVSCDETAVLGTFDGRIMKMNILERQCCLVSESQPHSTAVRSLAVELPFVHSVGEDGCVCISDLSSDSQSSLVHYSADSSFLHMCKLSTNMQSSLLVSDSNGALRILGGHGLNELENLVEVHTDVVRQFCVFPLPSTFIVVAGSDDRSISVYSLVLDQS
eukprot:ANDGO_04272.mRNA.1 hypothetical protein